MNADQFKMHDTKRRRPRLRIGRIIVETVPEEYPDLSYLQT